MTEGHDPSAGEQRVSIVTGDRLCTGCGYNLVGQLVVREPHYALCIVRCPECGAVAGVQEYPLLGRWAGRWGAVLAVLWCILLLAMWPATSGALCGISVATSEQAAHTYGERLRVIHREQVADALAQAAANAVPTVPLPGAPAIVSVQTQQFLAARAGAADDFGAWWKTQDPAALFAEAGGWRGAVKLEVILLWIPAGLLAFAIGWFWTVALLHMRRRVVAIWAIAIIGLAALFASFIFVDWINDEPSWYWQAARGQIAPTMLVLTLGFLMAPLVAGILAGRSLTRLVVRLLLPPRLRGALALLWITDGLPPPAVGRSRPPAPRRS